MRHNTIARNTGDSGVYVADSDISGPYYSTVALTNTILVEHTVGITVAVGNTATLESTLWGNSTDWDGAGNIVRTNDYWGEPVFVNPNAGNYHIGLGSAAIDEGVDEGVATDKDGVTRPYGIAPDLGAYEYFPPVGGHTELMSASALLGPWVALIVAVVTGAIGAVMLKRRAA